MAFEPRYEITDSLKQSPSRSTSSVHSMWVIFLTMNFQKLIFDIIYGPFVLHILAHYRKFARLIRVNWTGSRRLRKGYFLRSMSFTVWLPVRLLSGTLTARLNRFRMGMAFTRTNR